MNITTHGIERCVARASKLFRHKHTTKGENQREQKKPTARSLAPIGTHVRLELCPFLSLPLLLTSHLMTLMYILLENDC